MPEQGVFGGPTVCQTNPDGSPNSNQCYQTCCSQSLALTRIPAGANISLTNPNQQNRIIAVSDQGLSLEVTNDNSSIEDAVAITVTDKAACPNVVVNDSNCQSVAPGAHCTLELTSLRPMHPVQSPSTAIIRTLLED